MGSSVQFDGHPADANALGIYTPLGYHYSAIPDAMYPPDPGLVREWRRIDPAFRLLWKTVIWRSPNGGVFKTGHHVLARQVRNPHSAAPTCPGLLLPTSPCSMSWVAPILAARTLDGLSDSEINRGCLPRYQPFDRQVVNSLRWVWWRRSHKTADEMAQADADEARAKREAGLRDAKNKVG